MNIKIFGNPIVGGNSKSKVKGMVDFKEFDFTLTKNKPAIIKAGKPAMIKSFGRLIKAFGAELGIFDQPEHDIVEGETRIKDGKTYEIRRSKKNPDVRRLFKR